MIATSGPEHDEAGSRALRDINFLKGHQMRSRLLQMFADSIALTHASFSSVHGEHTEAGPILRRSNLTGQPFTLDDCHSCAPNPVSILLAEVRMLGSESADLVELSHAKSSQFLLASKRQNTTSMSASLSCNVEALAALVADK